MSVTVEPKGEIELYEIEEEVLPAEEATSLITMTKYELNKSIRRQQKAKEGKELDSLLEDLANLCIAHQNRKYFMLLNRELNFHRIFAFTKDTSNHQKKEALIKEFKEFLEQYDYSLVDLEPDEVDNEAIWIWVKENNGEEDAFIYVLYSYAEGVVEI